jgi:CheY-like chemotaxis protein
MHGGQVEAHSAGPDAGSEFVIRLPRAAAPQPVEAPARCAAACGQGQRILVVDDNEDGAESMSALLTLLGNEVRTAHDGEEAVRVAAEFAPRIILLDIGLPKLNGYEAARRIRALPHGSETVLIALTGWGNAPDRQRSKDAGFDHHLVKPVEIPVLRDLLGAAGAAVG